MRVTAVTRASSWAKLITVLELREGNFPMWQKFTERARRVILLGQEEAAKAGTLGVCTHHFLLGIMRDESCVAARLLGRMKVPLNDVRVQLQNAPRTVARSVASAPARPSRLKRFFGARIAPAPPTSAASNEPKLTAQAKRVLKLSADEARRLQHDYIGTEHLLLALIRQDTATAAIVLFKAGLTLEKVRAELVDYLRSDEAKTAKTATPGPADVPDAGAWARFTERARHAIVRAQTEATSLNCDYVGSAHLLLGLLLESEGSTAQFLRQLGLNAESVRAAIAAQAPPQVGTKEPALTPRANTVLRLAAEESKRLGCNAIGMEHLLLGLARVPDSEDYVTPIGQHRPQYWKAWNMSFAAGQTHLVEVRYSNPPSAGVTTNLRAFTGYNFSNYDINGPTDYQMADYGFPRRVMFSELGKLRMMQYILVTGSYWRGPIERCTVEADIEAVVDDAICAVFPPAQILNSQRILWSWTDIEPPRNIRLIFLSDAPKKIIPYLEQIAARNPNDLALRDNLADMKADFLDEEKVRLRRKKFVSDGQTPAL